MFSVVITRPQGSNPFYEGFGYGNGHNVSIHVAGMGTANGFVQRILPDGRIEEEGFILADTPELARLVLEECTSEYWRQRMTLGNTDGLNIECP